jgi:hypothetical protein
MPIPNFGPWHNPKLALIHHDQHINHSGGVRRPIRRMAPQIHANMARARRVNTPAFDLAAKQHAVPAIKDGINWSI